MSSSHLHEAETMADRVGQHLGNYRLVSLLSQGGYAEVYLGQHLRLDLQAAIKVLHTHLSGKEAEHFQQEAETIAKLRHPAIVRVFDFDVQEGVPFLVMDYAPNGSLRRRHPQGEVVPLPQIISYVKQIAGALQYAHDQKLIHRDVKPENMLLGWHEEVLLSDFGIATAVHSTGSLSGEAAVGTLAYMAPEQIQGHPRPASDQYALGVVVYEWLCGARPFSGSLAELVTQHLWQSPPPLQDRAPTITPAVEQVVLRALAKDLKQRFTTVAAFAEALEQASQESALPAVPGSPGLPTEELPSASRSAIPTGLAISSDVLQSSREYATPEGQATALTPPTQQFPDIPSAVSNQLLAPKVLHNLPPQYGDFLGRQKDLARVLEGLSSSWPLISIEGLAGMGKTRLAIEAAHCCIPGSKTAINAPFEVAVWVSAGDRPEQKRWINEVLDTVARVLGYPDVTRLPPEQKLIEVDHLLRNRRTLVIVDNFETIDDPDLLKWIQRVPEPSKALITTRHHHLRQVWDIHLKGLADKEALDLIRRNAQRLNLQSVQAASDELLLPLVRVSEGTPRIIELALGYIKGGRLSFQEVVDNLYKATRTVESIFDDLFARTWILMSRNAQQVLMVMPFFADSASKEALGTAASLSGDDLDTAVQQLVEFALLDINEELAVSTQRYSTHPLTRAFASSKLSEEQAFMMEARIRWSKYYVEYATRNIVREKSREAYWNVLTSRGYMELDLEWPNLQNVLAWSVNQKQDEILLELMLLLSHYLGRRLLYLQRMYYARLAAEAAQRLNRKKDEAWLRIDALGYILIEDGRFEDAKQEVSAGLQIAQNMAVEGSDATDLSALGHAFLARAFLEQGDVAEAATIIESVVHLVCTPLIQCRVEMIAGNIAVKKKNYKEAISLYEAATRITQQEEDFDFEAILRYRLGTAYLANKELTRAEEEFKKVPEQQGMNILAMYTKYGLACVALAKGDKEQARRQAQIILEVLTRYTSTHQLLRLVNNFLDSLD
jgi:serine/threonine protein kinase/tetratricopeptide (TPR) repeat protein